LIKDKSLIEDYLITNILGGLGNQLFCYYSSLSLATNKKLKLFIDNHDYKFYRKDRGFILDKFNIKFNVVEKDILKEFKYMPLTKLDFYFLNKFKINVFKKNNKILRENEDYNLDEVLGRIKPNSYIQGYLQNVNYLIDVKKIMQREITLYKTNRVIEQLSRKIRNSNSCSVHVRRGDYLIKPFNSIYNICSQKYYKNSFEVVTSKIEKPHYFIFTDDIEWTKKEFNNIENKTFISDYNLKNYQEFYLLSICKNHIISNSTFSFIAAWLNYNNNLVIEPKNWFKNKPSGNKIVDGWVKLDN